MSRLRQTMFMDEYTSRFKQVIATLEWEDASLIDRFYKGLKKEVKDRINVLDQLKEFIAYVVLATRIDIRMYQRHIERVRRGGRRTIPYLKTN